MSEVIKGNGGVTMIDGDETYHPDHSLNKRYDKVDYPKFVDSLRAGKHSDTLLISMLHAAVGISGEAGELLDHMKKAVWQDHKLDFDYITLELGDILFYLTSMCNCVGTDIDEVRKLNIEKLTKRYPDGVFDKERSINRNE